MIEEVTTTARALDFSFYLVLWISIVLLIGVTATMLFFVFRYSHKRNPTPRSIHGNLWLEIIWTFIPTVLVMVMFYYGWTGYVIARTAPDDAMVIKVTGQMWSWLFEYRNGKSSPDLVVPVHQPVKLLLNSRDVVHSFYVAAFRMKEDVVPGIQTQMWFEPSKEGEYDIQCAEYCGARHWAMLAKLRVVSAEEFDRWYNTIIPVEEMGGEELLRLKGCLSCHTTTAAAGIGPSFKGLFGKKEIVRVRGKDVPVTADEEYLQESILEPDAKVVKGYPAGQMPAQKGLLKDEELTAIIEYLKQLQ